MTTEVSEGMWDGVMGTGLLSDEHGRAWNTWYDGAAFANALSTLTGKELCYVDSDPTDSVDQYDSLDPSFATPYECEGYRLLTEAEWEYASRSGSAEEFWTQMVAGIILIMLVGIMIMRHSSIWTLKFSMVVRNHH